MSFLHGQKYSVLHTLSLNGIPALGIFEGSLSISFKKHLYLEQRIQGLRNMYIKFESHINHCHISKCLVPNHSENFILWVPQTLMTMHSQMSFLNLKMASKSKNQILGEWKLCFQRSWAPITTLHDQNSKYWRVNWQSAFNEKNYKQNYEQEALTP